MTPPLHSSNVDPFAEALVLEVKAEMGRRDLSSRALGRMIGESSQYVSMRLDGGNPRTGKRVPLTVRDIAAISSALELDADEFLRRAQAALEHPDRVADRIAAEKSEAARSVADIAAAREISRRIEAVTGDGLAPLEDLPRVADPNSMEDAEREALEQEGQD